MQGYKEITTTIPDELCIEAPCKLCDHDTRHRILAETFAHWINEDDTVDVWDRYQIIQCQGCQSVSFRVASKCSECIAFDERSGRQYYRESVELFPNRICGRRFIRDSNLFPDTVLRLYEEVHGALCAKFSSLVVMGLRSLIDIVCIDQKIHEENLYLRIEALSKSGCISCEEAKTLHRLRHMGNAAVHENKEHTDQQIGAAYDVVEHLLIGIYVIPSKAARLPKG